MTILKTPWTFTMSRAHSLRSVFSGRYKNVRFFLAYSFECTAWIMMKDKPLLTKIGDDTAWHGHYLSGTKYLKSLDACVYAS